MTLWRADTEFVEPDDFIVHTGSGGKHSPSNLRRDVLSLAIVRANVELVKAGIAPIPHVTFHSFRRTYATVQRFLESSDYVADQLGHEDARFTDRIYRQTPKHRRDRLAPSHRDAFDRAVEWARIGGAVLPVEEDSEGSLGTPVGTSEPLTVPAFDTEATKSPV